MRACASVADVARAGDFFMQKSRIASDPVASTPPARGHIRRGGVTSGLPRLDTDASRNRDL
jgi:hypothetical protein